MTDIEPPALPGVSALVRIETGGFCSIYRGRQNRTERGVAVKVLLAPFDRNTRAQFDAERVRIARLRHVPAILQVDEVDTLADGRPYLVSELCTESVADRLERGERLPEQEVVALGRDVAEALAFAHEVEIVHGSVTPRNVLYRRTGQPVLSDFGLALRQSYPGDPGDNGEFAAPETLRDGSLTARSDLYGLGATLHAALSGQPPFPTRIGEHPSERILRVISQNAPTLAPSMASPTLAKVVSDLLATRPEDRPGDAASVAERFTRLSEAPAPAAPPTGPQRPESEMPPAETKSAPPPPVRTQQLEPSVDPPALDASTDWSGLLDDVLFDAEPIEEADRPEIAGQPAARAARPTGRRRMPGLVAAAILALVVLAGLAVLLGRTLGSGPAGQADPTPTVPPSAQATPGHSALPAVRLLAARDHGRSVALTWRGPATLNYAVVVAEPGETTQVVLAHHARQFQIDVVPGRQYCFAIQATDGTHVVESDPRPIRGAVCHD